MISYAQNLEDVMLYRALKHIKTGFYVDVGANDPKIDSVTLAFYERGWRGINIEPLEQHYRDLQLQRPLDINLRIAAGPTKAKIKIWECDVRGWATAEPNVIQQHTLNGHKGQFIEVPMVPLTTICEAHVSGEIHFLKIDVEGFEKSVLDGFDFGVFKPWIVVVEATKPSSTEENHLEWEPQLLQSNYCLAYADGLNRFYVSPDHPELMKSLKYPPSVLDLYGTAKDVSFNARISDLQARGLEQERAVIAHRSVIEDQAADVKRLNSQLEAANVQLSQLVVAANEANLKAEIASLMADEAKLKVEITSLNFTSVSEKSGMQQAIIEELRSHSKVITECLATAQAETAAAHVRTNEVTGQLDFLENAFNQASTSLISANEKIDALYASSSWRITGPIRRFVRLIKSENSPPVVSSTAERLDAHTQIFTNEPAKFVRVDIQSLLSEIRLELGTSSYGNFESSASALSTLNNGRIKRLRAIWFRFPPSVRHRIRRLPFFFRVYRQIAFKQ